MTVFALLKPAGHSRDTHGQQRLLMACVKTAGWVVIFREELMKPSCPAAVCPLDDVSGLNVSIQTEMAVEQLKQKHEQELQQLRIQLETQVKTPVATAAHG